MERIRRSGTRTKRVIRSLLLCLLFG